MVFLTYTLIIGAAVAWGVIAMIAAYFLTLSLRYVRGLWRAIRFTVGLYENLSAEERQAITKLTLLKNAFFNWRRLTWIVSDSYMPQKDKHFNVKNDVIGKE